MLSTSVPAKQHLEASRSSEITISFLREGAQEGAHSFVRVFLGAKTTLGLEANLGQLTNIQSGVSCRRVDARCDQLRTQRRRADP